MTFVTEPEPDWRQRKKNATRDRIRASALRLFGEQGYDATTVEQIAAAAGVSHMTFFRYFPAKEDVALSDSYDPLLVGLLEQTPAGWPLIDRIRTALLGGLLEALRHRPRHPARAEQAHHRHPRAARTAVGQPDGHPAAHPPDPRH
jgi:AcrR family transcriptional regulator